MPQVEVDVQNIPDIIEAQLTLSYSRLSDLIRIIIDQGNSHDEEITGIHDDVGELRSENELLKKEIELLKARGSDQSLQATVEFLKKEVERLSAASEAHTKQADDHHAAHCAEEQALRDLLGEHDRLLKHLGQGLDETNQQVRAHETRLGLAEAFTGLWGGRPEQIFTMAARSNPSDRNSDYEHSVEARTQYLHTLPAFATLFDELNVVRGMLQKQSAEALATKSEMRSRHSSEVGSPSAQDALRAVEVLEARMLAVENGRLPPLEAAMQNRSPTGAAPVASEVDLSGVEKDIGQLQDRLSLLDDRLRALLSQPTAESGEAGNIALTDLTHRVEWLEDVVEGLPASNAATAASAAAAAAAAAVAAAAGASGVPVEVDVASESRRTPENAVVGAVTPPLAAEEEAASPVPQQPSSASSEAASARPASASGKLSARPSSGRAHLPPISPTYANNANNAATTTAAPAAGAADTPLAARSRSSVLGGHLNNIPQPVLNALKVQEEEQPRDPRRASRRISVVMEPEDGLRRRVAMLEENCAILEVNKADRTELQALEDAIRQALSQHQFTPLAESNSAPVNAGSMAPRRPPTARVSLTDNNGLGMGDGVVMRPRSSAAGRPMFVGSSATYLRDGATRTQVTVSPTRLSGTY